MKNYLKLAIVILSLFNLKAQGQEKRTFIVGVESYAKYPLYSFYNEEYVGKYRVILDKFAEENDYIFFYLPYKHKELYYQLYNNNIDLKFPDNPTWRAYEKNNYNVIYSDYIYSYIEAIFVKKANLGYSLKNYKIVGILENSMIWTLNKKAKKNKITLVKANSCAELLALLISNKIDSLVCNYDVMQHLLKDSLIAQEVVFDPSLPFVDDYYHISSISYPEMIKKFNQWLAKNRTYIKEVMDEEYIRFIE